MEEKLKSLKNTIFKEQNRLFSRCLWPLSKCSNKAIRAHSIQNKGVLDLVSVMDHVIQITQKQNLETGPTGLFNSVGRRKATTFTGLCSEHDNLLFKPIDDHELDLSNQEHLFLLAYRSTLRELHAKMRVASMLAEVTKKANEIRQIEINDLNDPASLPVSAAVLEAYMFYKHKHCFDQVYRNRDFGSVAHEVIVLKDVQPNLAASIVYEPIKSTSVSSEGLKLLILNVFPLDCTQMAVVFSFQLAQKAQLIEYVNEVILGNPSHQKYLLSKRILMYGENFVLSPRHFETFSESKKNAILEYFFVNLSRDKCDRDDVELYLF